MSYKADTGLFDKVLFPDTLNGDKSRSFTVPLGAKVGTFYLPDTTAVSWRIQALSPRASDQEAEVWTDLTSVVVAGTIAFMAVASFPDNTTISCPVTVLGGGSSILRLVTVTTVTAAVDSIIIPIAWGLDG
jgi:hypothetical protein